jgi:hypothetical protein
MGVLRVSNASWDGLNFLFPMGDFFFEWLPLDT